MKKKIFKNTLIFTMMGFLPSLTSFILLPIFLNHFTIEEYGILSLLTAFMAFLGIVIDWQLLAGYQVFYFDYYKDKKALLKFNQNLFSFNIFLSLIMALILYIIGPYAFLILFKSNEIKFETYGLYLMITTFFGAISSLYLIFLRIELRMKNLVLYRLLGFILSISLQYIFIVVLQKGVLGSIQGSMFASLIIGIIVLIQNRNLLILKIDLEPIKKVLNYTLPLVSMLLLLWISNKYDRVFLERFMSLEEVGIYSLLMNVLGVSLLIVQAVENAVKPDLYKFMKVSVTKNIKFINQFFEMYIYIGMITISLVLMVGFNFNLLTDNAKYLAIKDYMLLASVIFLIKAFSTIFKEPIFFFKKSKIILSITFIFVLILISLFLCFINRFGIHGLIYAFIIATSLEACMYFYYSKRYLKVNFDLKNLVLIPFIIFGLIIALYLLFNTLYLATNIFGIVQFIVVFLTVLWFKKDNFKNLINQL